MPTKYSGYEDFQPKRIIKQGIDDFLPYEIVFPDPPPIEEFINFGLPADQQFFTREKIPSWVHQLNKKKREDAYDTVRQNNYMAEWIDGQWRKRNQGVWMFIKGQPLYIPGKYWWYMNYYYQNTEHGVDLGDFRYPDLEWFWIWSLFILPNPNIYGLIEFTMRRDGKSARSMAEDLEEISKTANVKAGMQSKTDKDARDTFQEFVVEPWRRLPFFFNPMFDNKTYPSKELNFRTPSVAGRENDASILAEASNQELGSSMEVRATVKTAFDGRKLKRYTLDEAGKCEEMNTHEAWRVHKQCLRVGQKLVGKAKITTTVEKMPKLGMEPFFNIWDESDRSPDKLTKLLQTVSGLVPLFKPGYEAFIYDRFGFPIIHTPTEEQAEYRRQVLISENRHQEVSLGYHKIGGKELLEMEAASFTEPEARQSFMRMYPPSIREARRSDGSGCHFPAHVHIIDQRLDDLKYGNAKDEEYVGNLAWKDGIRFGEVIWKPCTHKDRHNKSFGTLCPTCRWRFFYLPFQYANKNYQQNGMWYPGNKGMGMVSSDTWKYDKTEGTRKSTGTSHGYMEYDISIDGDKPHHLQVTDDFIFEYGARLNSKRLYGEDMVMTCWFLGWQIFPETNVPFVWDYFVESGMEKFLKHRHLMKKTDSGHIKVQESITPGIVTLGDAIKDPMFSAAEAYLDKNGYKSRAVRFLQDCRDVEYAKLTKYDYFVSGSQCLYARSMVTKPKMQKETPKQYDVGKMMTFRRAGT